ncbi:hypothetical protein BP6252_08168 [Coleophoma cylindrospora]|uniref:Uncharacterized protein n=1 Tax=Coleophoma cylindrospora TaxID=1849047 RepID=A0A3D8RC63_9HELO|nr:hypothetical protein BP6252_08168 [Coleophoma cylindrospora]
MLPMAEQAAALAKVDLSPKLETADKISQSSGTKELGNLTVHASIEALPNELLGHIFGYLDVPRPSPTKLRDEPTFEATSCDTASTKAISLVSKRWRTIVFASLFKHARILTSKSWLFDATWRNEIQPFVDFAVQRSLHDIVQSFAICVPTIKLTEFSLSKLPFPGLENIWQMLFRCIDPEEILIVGPPQALGALTACYVELGDAYIYDCPYQYLHLRRSPDVAVKTVEEFEAEFHLNPDGTETKVQTEKCDEGRKDVENSASNYRPSPLVAETFPERSAGPRVPAERSTLFQIRPWHSLLLNEGSFIKSYTVVDDIVFKGAPSIITDLVGAPDDHFSDASDGLISGTVREFSYIGIFPPESHFRRFAEHLPRIDSLYMQLVPRNNILDDEERMQGVVQDELWLERNSCYASVMRELFNTPPTNNFAYLREFESGDTVDQDAWLMAVEFVKRAGRGFGWSVARDGVFVREVKDGEGNASSEPEFPTALSVTN